MRRSCSAGTMPMLGLCAALLLLLLLPAVLGREMPPSDLPPQQGEAAETGKSSGEGDAKRRQQSRVIAVGDVHGDLAQLRAMLQLCGIIDDEGAWVDNQQSVVVQVGDLLDRGPHDKAVMDFVMRLQQEAAAAGGAVVSLLGNHELMNLQGQFHYVHPESHEDFGGRFNRKREFSAAGSYGAWLRKNPVVHVEGSTLFVHAGLAPAITASLGLEGINEEARRLLSSPKALATAHDSDVFGVHGPIWTRLLITDATNGRCHDVEATLKLLPGIERMVVGHTPQRSGRVETYCDDRLIAVDVGMSKWMYGHLAALEIIEFVDDSGVRRVEMREVLPNTAVEAADGASGSNGKGGGAAASTSAAEDAKVATGLQEDPMLLQELMETIQELKALKIKSSALGGHADDKSTDRNGDAESRDEL